MEKKKGIILVSYGNASKESRKKTIDKIETKVKELFPKHWVKSAFTSRYIINKVQEREQIKILSFEEALQCALNDGVESIIIQQLHLVNGYVGVEELKEIKKFENSFQQIVIGRHLLAEKQDVKRVASIIIEESEKYMKEKTAVCFIGHGTESNSSADYMGIQNVLWEQGHKECFIGLLHGRPDASDLLSMIPKRTFKRIVLIPLILTTGYHVRKNIVGDEEKSWKTIFEQEGYEVQCVIKGLGEYEKIQEIFLEHLKNAVRKLEEE